MTKIFCLFSIIISTTQFCLAQLTTPIEGIYGDDYIIVNYPDWNAIQNGPVHLEDTLINDYRCGTKTYDGHQGTDYVIKSFVQMDDTVYVVAIADGIVYPIIQNLFDRETMGIVSLGLGNYIGIYHPTTNTWSYYAHLKKNSALVTYGQSVVAGQRIAQVGSSGNSTDPHLHFEYWEDGVPVTAPTIDPWGSPCNGGNSLWNNPDPYDTTYNVWEIGMMNYIPSLDDLKERTNLKDTFTEFDSHITFWTLHYGLRTGDSTRVEWIDPSGMLYAQTTKIYPTDLWYNYYHTYITTPPTSLFGLWAVKFYHNNILKESKPFIYGTSGTNNLEEKTIIKPQYRIENNSFKLTLPKNTLANSAVLYNITGQELINIKLTHTEKIELQLPIKHSKGIYFVTIKHSQGEFAYKVLY